MKWDELVSWEEESREGTSANLSNASELLLSTHLPGPKGGCRIREGIFCEWELKAESRTEMNSQLEPQGDGLRSRTKKRVSSCFLCLCSSKMHDSLWLLPSSNHRRLSTLPSPNPSSPPAQTTSGNRLHSRTSAGRPYPRNNRRPAPSQDPSCRPALLSKRLDPAQLPSRCLPSRRCL